MVLADSYGALLDQGAIAADPAQRTVLAKLEALR